MKKLKTTMLTLLSIIFIAAGSLTVQAEEGTTTAIKLSKYSELDTKSQDSNSGMIDGTFKEDVYATAQQKVYKIIAPEKGLFRINYTSVSRSEGYAMSRNDYVKFSLYSNPACTKLIEKQIELYGDSDNEDLFYTLDAGTYYLAVSPTVRKAAQNIDITFSASFGYLDANTEFIKVAKSYDSSIKSVVLDIAANDIKELRAQEGKYLYSSWTWDLYWKDKPLITNGKYIITKNGDYSIRLIDLYGNLYTKLVTVNEFQTPAKPTIASYKSGTKKVTGKTSANCSVNVIVNGKTYTTRSNSTGTYSIATAPLTVGSKITVTSTNSFGITSEKAAATVKNQRIAKPNVRTFKKNTRYVKGTAKKNTTAYVKIGKKTYKSNVNSKGRFSVKVARLKANTRIKVTIKDKFKNYSATVTVKVK